MSSWNKEELNPRPNEKARNATPPWIAEAMSQGGGFLPGSGGSGFRSREGREKQHYRPIALSQVGDVEAPDGEGEFTLDGVPVGKVVIVAILRSVQRHAANINFTVEDGTGTIDARHWYPNSEEDTVKEEETWVGKYMAFFGDLKEFSDKRYLNATQYRLVEDPNEVFYHVMEVKFANKLIRKRTGQEAGGDGENPYSMGALRSAGGGSASRFDTLPSVQKQIMTYVQRRFTAGDVDSEGLTMLDLQTGTGLDKLDADKFRGEIDELMGSGYLFETKDDTFMIAD